MRGKKLSLMIEDVKARKGSFIPNLNPMWRDVAVFNTTKPGRSWSQLRAASMNELVNIVELAIYPEWTLAEEHLNPGCGVEYGMRILPDESSRQDALRRLGLEDRYNDIKTAVDAFLHQSCSTAPGEIDPRNALGLGTWTSSGTDEVYWGTGWIDNHSIRDYEKLVRLGYGGLKMEIESQLLSHPITDPDYPYRGKLPARRVACL